MGTGVFSAVPSVLLLYFLTQHLQIAVAVASTVILLPKIAGIALDPAIGLWSDQSSTRFGRRRPFMVVGAVLLPVGFVALFHLTRFADPAWTSVAAGLTYAGVVFGYSLFAVPYSTIPGEARVSEVERTGLLTVRFLFVFLGLILGAGIAPLLVSSYGGGGRGYGNMSWILALVCLPALLAAAVFSPENQPPDPNATRLSRGMRNLFAPLAQARFRGLAAAFSLLMAGTGTATAAVAYFVEFVLRRPGSMVGYWLLAMLGASFASVIAWGALLPRLGRRKALTLAVALCLMGTLGVWGLARDQTALAIVAAAIVAGIGFGGLQITSFAVLADEIQRDSVDGGGHREANLTGLWTAAEKFGLAVGPAVVGGVLLASGFVAHAGADRQSLGAQSGIRFAAAGAPALLFALGWWLMLRGMPRSSAWPSQGRAPDPSCP